MKKGTRIRPVHGLLVAALLTLTACANGPAPPTGPTPVLPPPPTTPLDMPPLASEEYGEEQPEWFDDKIWRELVFDGTGNDRPRDKTMPIPASDRQYYGIYIKTTDSAGEAVAHENHISYIEQTFSRIVTDLTDEKNHRGKVEVGTEDQQDRPGRVVVRYISVSERDEKWPEKRGLHLCGRAEWKRNIRWIWIVTRPECMSSYKFERIIAHELGHIFGLRHSSNSTHLMRPGGQAKYLTEEEIRHSRLMYSIRPGSPYCGWPYGPNGPKC